MIKENSNSSHSEFYRKEFMIDWSVSKNPVEYARALACMNSHIEAMINGKAGEWIWLLEHPPLYTAGTSARSDDLLDAKRFPVYQTNRGGQYTYHGPGQRIIYVMLDLKRRKQDVRAFIHSLENWIILTLAERGITAHTSPDRVGIWVKHFDPTTQSIKEKKIAALGIRLRKWISFHGIALNILPDLEHFSGIIPCGLESYGVTSLKAFEQNIVLDSLDQTLEKVCQKIYGPTQYKSFSEEAFLKA